MDDFNEDDYVGLTAPICPACGDEISDVGNGGDPRAWWSSENIPDCDLQHECRCGQVFRVNVSWTPLFSVIPVEFDDEYENDYSGLDEA